jgi:hypothetical protein
MGSIELAQMPAYVVATIIIRVLASVVFMHPLLNFSENAIPTYCHWRKNCDPQAELHAAGSDRE